MWWRALLVAVAMAMAVETLLSGPSSRVSDRAVAIASLPCTPGPQSTSSGFVIDHQLVVTVAHAIYESNEFALRDATGRWHRPVIMHMDLDLDVTVLYVPGLAAAPLPASQLGADDFVRVIEGAASGTNSGAVLRRVRLTTEVIGDGERTSERSGYELSVPIKPGDSGSAVVDADDNLIGMIFARSTQREASWATSASEIFQALDRREVPSWDCSNPSGASLILDIPDLNPQAQELAAAGKLTSPE